MVDSTNYVPVGPMFSSHGPDFSIFDASTGFTEYLGAQVGNVLRDSPTSSIYRAIELGRAGRYAFDPIPDDLPADSYLRETLERDRQRFTRVSNTQAKAQIADAGLTLDIGDGPISQEALDILIRRGLERQEREISIAGYNPSMVSQLTTAVGASLLDPVNIAAGFVPFVGQTRAANMLARAGSFGGRTMARAKIGAIEGLGGAALVEPLIAGAATQEGRDYTAFLALQNLLFGAGFGSGLHMAFGAAAERITGRTYRRSPAETPGDLVDRLPYEAKEAAMRAAVADVLSGREVSASDVLDYIAKQDPDLAEQLQYVATLRRDGPDIDDTLARVEYWKGKLSGKRRTPEQTSVEDFMQWVRSHGGVRDTEGLLEAALDETLPRTAMIKRKGLNRTDRGVEFEELFKRAVEAGFVRTREEFIDAFKAGQKSSPLRPVLREVDERQRLEAAEILREEQEYIEAAQAASGVNPRAKAETRARAIVGREQHVVAAERARLNTAIDRLIARREAIARGEAPPPPPKEEQSAQTRAEIEAGQVKEGEEVPEAGDTVNILDETGSPTAISDAGPDVTVKSIYTDPNYGTYVFFDESAGLGAGGIPVGRVKVVKKAEKPTAGPLSEAIQQDQAKEAKATVDKKVKREAEAAAKKAGEAPAEDIHPGIVARAIRKEMERLERPITYKELQTALGGSEAIGIKKLKNLIAAVLKNDPRYARTKIGNQDAIRKQKLTKEQKESQTLKVYRGKVEAARDALDEQFPNLAAQKLYYLHALEDVARTFEAGEKNLRIYLNEEMKAGRLEAEVEGSGKALKTLDSSYFSNPDAPGILLRFSEETNKAAGFGNRMQHQKLMGKEPKEPSVKTKAKTAKLGPLSPEEKAAAAAEYAKLGSANRRVDTPPAEKEALTSPELNDITARYQQIEADTAARLERILPLLPEDTAATIRAQLTKVDREANDLLDVYETAVKCLLKPPV